MSINRLTRISGQAEKESYLRYQPQNILSEPVTLSTIAQRLRLVHNQMKKRDQMARQTQTDLVEPTEVLAQQAEDGVKSYLDDIARALLAEYNARRQTQERLLAHLTRLEQLIQNGIQEKRKKAYLYKQTLVQDTVAAVQLTLKHEFTQQAEKLAAENQKNNDELSRQLREVTAASRFSVQIASLQQQIANIQATLDGQKEARKTIPANFVLEETNERPPMAENSAAQTAETCTKKTFNKPVIRILAEKNGISSVGYSLNGFSSNRRNNGHQFDPQQSGEMIACARTINKQGLSRLSENQQYKNTQDD